MSDLILLPIIIAIWVFQWYADKRMKERKRALKQAESSNQSTQKYQAEPKTTSKEAPPPASLPDALSSYFESITGESTVEEAPPYPLEPQPIETSDIVEELKPEPIFEETPRPSVKIQLQKPAIVKSTKIDRPLIETHPSAILQGIVYSIVLGPPKCLSRKKLRNSF